MLSLCLFCFERHLLVSTLHPTACKNINVSGLVVLCRDFPESMLFWKRFEVWASFNGFGSVCYFRLLVYMQMGVLMCTCKHLFFTEVVIYIYIFIYLCCYFHICLMWIITCCT